VLDLGLGDRWLLFKTDAVVEGVHFTAETPAHLVGRKALARCLSDIAAMAGDPTGALVTLALPAGFDAARVEAAYTGLNQLAREFGVAIVGGETTTSPGGWLISVALLGTVARDRCVLRSGARAGDALFVTGELGGALRGKHLEFTPRLAEARWLAGHFRVHAMLDLSDGLAGDLRHLLNASGVGAELLADAIPVSRAAKLQARDHPTAHPPLTAALADGEDFELLFAVAPAEAVPLADAWRTAFPGVRLSCVGRVSAEPGLRLRDRRGIRPLAAHGYAHFQQP